jgi:hypothetical protein
LGREGENATANSMAGKRPRIRGQGGEKGGEKVSGGLEELRRGILATRRGLRRTKSWESFSRGRGNTGIYTGELDWAKLAGHRTSTADRRSRTGDAKFGRAQSGTREIKHGQRCLTSGRSSGRLGAVSGDLDGRERGRGSPATSGGEGRAAQNEAGERVRALAGERGHWRGSKKGAGCVGGRRGREIRRRAQVRTRRSTGRAELTGRVHGAETEKRDVRGNDLVPGNAGPRDRKRGGARGRRNRRRQVGPSGQRARERESARENKPPLTGGARLSGGARARPDWAELGWFGLLFLFLFLCIF